ncbi:SAM-dependent methyltransferase [Nannocystis punicea]|uniref:SAM-dependent methyltransferase n=1 Tax=Nannocystis punicea TaxID=2995304 RepID=A0ABY7GVZ1_9BACT|nr:SAM-dependent methyltransferase [Nannocystis poenicansa]WAS91140.1 SAM-dependent methyltransferase [Nannocystis poenicansa]
MTARRPQPPSHAYPDPEAHRRRWRQLAREIAARAATVSDDAQTLAPPERPGVLEILGSGIEAVGFTRADESRIRAADHVFYCVADPATKVWLLTERPDAYDLYVLYDDAKRRYLTYMQMAEAMLHPVRQGKRVVAVFYGHPGIFVLATHRALQIARREGHRAEMRPAVSALDTLCADLGVDPSQPGMQMYEATDMLIRGRRPDVGLHLVLWQVGLIGELGYRRQGYLNSNFSVLLDYLEALYGPEHPVVNYVGSRYPGVDPVIDRLTIAALRDPATQNWVTGISTFYLPPRQAAPADPAMLARLGLLRPGQSTRETTEALRVIDRYGPRERRAFRDFATFDVPQSYQWQPDTPAARFVLDLCENEALRERYRADPAGTLAAWDGGLSVRERDLLIKRDPGGIQLAAKGMRSTGESENRRILETLLNRKTCTASLLAAMKRAPAGQAHAAAEAWSRGEGMAADWRAMAGDLQSLLRRSLAAWTGLYLIGEAETSLSIHGRVGAAVTRVDLDGRRLAGIRFDKGVLSWTAEAGNPCSGYLQPDLTPRGKRRWVGLVWPANATPGSGHKVVALEHVPRPRLPASALVGDYAGRDETGEFCTVSIVPTSAGALVVEVDGGATERPLTIASDHFRVGDMVVPLSARVQQAWLAPYFHGACRLLVQQGAQAELVTMNIGAEELVIAGQRVVARAEGLDLSWTGGPASLAEGRVTLALDPVTLRPLIHGNATSKRGVPAALRGMGVMDEAAARVLLAGSPRLGLPGWAWRHLVTIMVGANAKGGLFLWEGYERASTNLARVRQVLTRLHGDDTD